MLKLYKTFLLSNETCCISILQILMKYNKGNSDQLLFVSISSAHSLSKLGVSSNVVRIYHLFSHTLYYLCFNKEEASLCKMS